MSQPRLAARLAAFSIVAMLGLRPLAAQSVPAAEAETKKCEDRIAAVQRDVLTKYDDALGEMLAAEQKAADLEGALAVRAERQRLAAEQTLVETNFVTEPKVLRNLQTQTVGKLHDLIAQLVTDTVPKLVELKKQLTVAGKLDDALAVRSAIERLQNNYLSTDRADANMTIPAETLLLAYSGDRARADKMYKGQKITVRGIVGGFRPDPADGKNYQVFLVGGSIGGWVQCNFLNGDHHFREEKAAYNVPVLIIATKDGDAVRLQKGTSFDVRGLCDGWDDAVQLARCDPAK